MAQILARGFIDVQIGEEYKMRNASLSCDGSGKAILSLLNTENHIEDKYTFPLANIDVHEIAPEYANAEAAFETEQKGYKFVMDLNRPLGAAFDSQGFVIDVSHEKQAHGHVFKGHRITKANNMSVKAFSEVVDQIKFMKSQGARQICLQFVDQDKLEATAIEADRLGALAYGRPHVFVLKLRDARYECSDKPGTAPFDDDLVIDDRDGELLLTLLPRLKREWQASEQFRSLLPNARMADLKNRKLSLVSLSGLSDDDEDDLDCEYYMNREKTFESMDQVDCIACLNVKDRAEVITSLDMADQATVLIELKLRGEYHDLLKEMDRIEVLSIKAALRNHAAEEATKEKCQMLNADACRLASSGFNSIGACADFIGGLPPDRGAALLRSFRLRGAAAGIVDRLRASTFANILNEDIHCDFLRGKLLCSAAPDRRGAAFQLLDHDVQVQTLSEMTDQHRKELLIMSVLWGGPSLEDALAKYESDPTPTKKKKSVSKKLKSGLQKASSLITGGSFFKEPDAQERPSSASVSRHSEARPSEIRSRAHTISEASAGGFVVEDEHYTVEMAAQDMVAGAKAAEAAKAAHNAAITPRNLSARGRSKSAASKLWGTGGVIENINPLMNNSDNGESKYNNESKSNDDYESKEDSKEEESKTPTKKERRVSTADVRTMLRGSIGSSQACSGRRSTRSSNGDFRHSQASEERKDSIGGGGGYDRSQYSAPSKRKSSRRVSSADVAALLRGSIHTN